MKSFNAQIKLLKIKKHRINMSNLAFAEMQYEIRRGYSEMRLGMEAILTLLKK